MRKPGRGPLELLPVRCTHTCTHLPQPPSQWAGPRMSIPDQFLQQDAPSPLGFFTHECTRLERAAGNSAGNRKNRSPAWGHTQLPAFLRAGSAVGSSDTGRWRQRGLWVIGSQPGRALPGPPSLFQRWPERGREVTWCAGPRRGIHCPPAVHPQLTRPGRVVPSLLPQEPPLTGRWFCQRRSPQILQS